MEDNSDRNSCKIGKRMENVDYGKQNSGVRRSWTGNFPFADSPCELILLKLYMYYCMRNTNKMKLKKEK